MIVLLSLLSCFCLKKQQNWADFHSKENDRFINFWICYVVL